MKKVLLALLGTLALAAAPAFADIANEAGGNPDQSPSNPTDSDSAASAYTCQLKGAISGLKLGFILDGQVLGGDAVIHCEDATHSGLHDVDMPVRVRVVGGGVGFDFTIVKRANLVTAGIGLVRRPADLLGEYSVAASAGVTLIERGYNIQSAISVKHRAHGIAFEVGFQGEKAIGLGARLNGLVMVVERR
ncbi:MAG: hypothetical protein ACXWSD_11240 [Bdellovibrionota bacterium]